MIIMRSYFLYLKKNDYCFIVLRTLNLCSNNLFFSSLLLRILLDNSYIQANSGTASIIPINPNKPPNKSIANKTQKLLIPILLPISFGPKIFPSNC